MAIRQSIGSGALGPVYINETVSTESIAGTGVYVNETAAVTVVTGTLSVTLGATTLAATAATKVIAALTVLLDNTTLSATAQVTAPLVIVARGGPPRRFIGEFDFKTLRTEFRKADERVVLEEVVEATSNAIDENKRVISAAQLAQEIKRIHEIRLSETRVRNLITKIRRDADFKAEQERFVARRKMEQDDDDEVMLLVLN